MSEPRAGIRSAIFVYLSQQESLVGSGSSSGPVGTTDDPAIYPFGAPADAPETYIVYKRSDRPDGRTLSGAGGIRRATFDFEVWGPDADVVESVAEALRASLEAIRGDWAGVSIRAVELQGEIDDSVRPEDGTDVTWPVTVLTARLSYVVLTGA